MQQVFLISGCNLGNRTDNMAMVLKEIEYSIGKVCNVSKLYETEPWGFSAKEPFLNQVIEVVTSLHPAEVLQKATQIENKMGRKRTGNGYSSRVMDIDLLFYGNLVIQRPDLEIPHPRLHLRRFVLEPLVEIAPDFIHPVLNKTILVLLNELDDEKGVSLYKE